MNFDVWRSELLTRCERNAMSQLDPNIQSMAETVIMDPLDHLSDRQIWITMFDEARKVSRDVYADLFFLRSCGTLIITKDAYGLSGTGWPYEFRPIVSERTWPSRQVFNEIMSEFFGRHGAEVFYRTMVETWEELR